MTTVVERRLLNFLIGLRDWYITAAIKFAKSNCNFMTFLWLLQFDSTTKMLFKEIYISERLIQFELFFKPDYF